MRAKKMEVQTSTQKVASSCSNVEKPYPVISCYPTDLRVHKLGGIETGIMSCLLKAAPRAPVRLVGVDAVGDLKPNSWNRVALNGVSFDFFPLFVEKELNRRTFPPLNARFLFHLWAKKKKIFSGPVVLELHRPDHLVPFWTDRRFPVVLTIHGSSKNLHLPNESWVSRFLPLYLLLERISLFRAEHVFCVVEEGVRH